MNLALMFIVLFSQSAWHNIAIGFAIAALVLFFINLFKEFRTVLVLSLAGVLLSISVLIALFA